MQNNEVEIKGWPAVLLITILVLGGGGYLIAIPGQLRPAERTAIIEHLRDERSIGLSASVESLKNDIHNEKQLQQTLALGKESLKKIEIVSAIVPPRGLSTAKRVKATYTIGGETPKDDGGVRYFRIRRHETKASRNNYQVYEIDKQRFESWW